MTERENCIFKYRKLLELLEREAELISRGIQGDILENYLNLLYREEELLRSELRSLQTNIK